MRWFKNGAPLSKEEGITSKRGNRHTLLLPGIRRRTFGDYECRASNKYGQDSSTTRVSGQFMVKERYNMPCSKNIEFQICLQHLVTCILA